MGRDTVGLGEAMLALALLAGCDRDRTGDDRAPESAAPSDSAPTTGPPPTASTGDTAPPPTPENVLLVILDDVGTQNIDRYGLGTIYPDTPRLDALADEGVTFRHAWSQPVCSSSRASMFTGRNPHQHLVWSFIRPHGDTPMAAAEVTLPELLTRGTGGAWDTAMVGKWHLASADRWYRLNPNTQGFAWFSGSVGHGMGDVASTDSQLDDYYSYEVVTNGESERRSTYRTTDSADAAIERLGVLQPPWLLVLSLHAAHEPLAWPPADLYDRAPGDTELIQQFHATITAADTELGRVFDAMTPEQVATTTVIVVGDNGASPETLPETEALAKASVYEGGVNVPLVVRGPRVAAPGSTCTALVQISDLFATVAELAGVPLDDGIARDSVSLVRYLEDPAAPSARETVYAEMIDPYLPNLSAHAVRDARWKLVEKLDGTRELYDLGEAAREGEPLAEPLDPAAAAARDRLAATFPYTFPL